MTHFSLNGCVRNFAAKSKKFFAGFFVVNLLLTLVTTNVAFAAAENIDCGSGGNRALTVGTYTDADGSSFTSGADLTLSQGAGAACTFSITQSESDSAISLSSLTIGSGVTLTHDAAGITAGTYNQLNLNISGALTVESGGAIDVTAKGYLGANSGANLSSSSGRTDGNVSGSDYGAGGSHGGSGGIVFTYYAGEVYDSISNPVQPGGGGGTGSLYNLAGNGGGVVKVTAASAAINGNILAKGECTAAHFAGGAGGSINLTLSGALTGSGTLSVSANANTYGDAVGGGGRIAVKGYTTLDTNLVFDVSGGNSTSSSRDGSSGTLFKKSSSDTYGHLILNNGSSSSYAYTTHLPYPVPSADQYAKYGAGYVFDDVTVSNYAELEISTSLDSSADGSANFTRKFYTASCTANDNDYSNGEIVYSSTYIRTADSSPALSDASYDYVCNAPAFLVGFSTTSASAKEDQTSQSFTVNASGVADAPATVDYAVSVSSTATVTSDYLLASGTATIGIGESSDVINFTIVDDTDRESSETLIVTLSNASGATLAATDTYTYTILDNDTPGVTIDTGGSTSVIEGGSTDTYTMVLDTQPTANVVITPAGDADVTTSPATLTFTSVNWATPQTVTVTAVNDSTAEGTESATATATAASSDVDYNGEGISIASVTVSVTDNDFAGVTLADSYSLSVNEQNTTTDTYTMVLDTPPTANVVITISPDSQCTTDLATATFTSSNWSTPQTITVTAVDDITPETYQSCSISHTASSSDTQYNGYSIISASASITDNDTPGITKAVPDDSATEGGGTASFTYVLNSQPTADVVITLTDGSSTDFTLSTYTVTFTTANWYTAQTVTLTAVDDTEPESTEYPSIGASTASADSGYEAMYTATPSINILDNDTPGITLETSDASATEGGGTAAFSYVLATQPTANVVITLTDGGSTDFTLSTSELTFTTSNWATPQTVTLTAIDDSEVEYTEYSSVVASTASADSGYEAIYTAVPSISLVDNDWITVTQSGGTTDATEGGATDSFTMVLSSDPYGTVEVTITPDADCTVDTPTLTFIYGTGLTPQTVNVTAVDDLLEEGDHTCTITYSVTDTNYTFSGVFVSPTVVNVSDNDGATGGFTIGSLTGGPTTEAGGTATFTVKLTTQPTGDVTIPLSSDDTTEGTISPSSLTFTSLNWESDQTVTLTGADDSSVDGNIAYNAVLGTTTSTDSSYNNLDPSDVSVTNNDNDTAGFTIGTISGTTTEAGGTATFTVKLTSQPTADVTIPLSSDDTTEGTISPTSLTFTSVNWNSTQTVTLTGVDDSTVDGNVAYSAVLGTTTSTDGNYSSLDPSDVSATNNDDDSVGFTVGAISGATAEDGSTATFTVKLTSQPTADVVIELSSSDTTEGTISPSSLTFTSVNWNSNQTVTLTGADDTLDDGDVVYTAILAAATSSDGLYSGQNPTDRSVTNTDNDTAGVTITESTSSTDVTEGGITDSFTVALATQPTANVVVTLSDDSDVTLDTNELTFTPSSWSAQTVTVTAYNDSIDENAEVSTVTFAVASTDSTYDDATYEGGMTIADVAINVTDNDTAGVTVGTVTGDTSESGTTATFTVVLDTQPTANVVIGLSSDDTTEGTVSPSSLTFTSGNWSTPQTATITGANDSLVDGSISYSIVTAAATSSDSKYSAINAADISLSNTDNDTAGVTVGSVTGNTTEAGGTATFTLVLNTQPTANVVIGVSSSDTTEGTVSPSSITFTTSNWNTPQSVTIAGVNDDAADGDVSYSVVTAAASSTDSDYNSVVNPSDVSLSNVDNDAIAITVSSVTGNPTTEAGGTATFTVVLGSQPSADVSVGLSSSDTTEGTVSPSSITFTSSNWSTPQTVTVTGADDSLDDGNISYSIVTDAATSSDSAYNGINPTNPSLSNTDNDTAGVTFSALSAAATTEAGGESTYTMVLDSQPTADVVIALSSSNTAEATVAPSSITFTASNWDQAQTVTITGVDEDIDDGNTAYTIAAVITTDDTTGYDGLALTNRSLTNTDNDTAAITVTYTTGATDEAGTNQLTFTVALSSQPTADVTVSVASSDTTEGTVSASSLIFTSANWATAQTVTITGADDTADDGAIAYSILLGPAVSADDSYDATVISSLTATNSDNDEAAATAVDGGSFFSSIVNTTINQSTPDVTDTEQPIFNGVKIENLQTKKLLVEDGNIDQITALVNEDEKTRVVIDEETNVTLADGEPYTGKIEVPTVIDQSQAVTSTSTFNASYSFVNAIFVDTHAQHIYFDKPVVVTVPLENLDINPDKIEIWTYNEKIQSWQKLDTKVKVNYGKRNVSFEVNKFSYIAVLQNQVFDDTQRHWASHFILDLTKEKVVKGVSKNNFEPDRAVTRAELLKMALLGFGHTVETGLPLNFKDVGLEHWSHDYVSTAVKKGLIMGYEDGTFKPDATVSRSEALKIVIKAGRLDVNNVGTAFKMQYSDTGFDLWYLPYLRFAAYKELVEYTKGAKFRPNDGMTRAEAAKIIVKTREL